MKEQNSTLVGHLACFVAYAIFGINIIVCKDLTTSQLISPIALFCLRSLGAGALFWIIALFLPRERVEPRDYLPIFAASILGFFLTQVAFLVAIEDITPIDCSIMLTLSPIYTMFIAAIAIKEPITWKKAGGVAISFCGILYLILNSATRSGGAAETQLSGVLFMLVNGVSFALYLGIFKPLIAKYSVVTFMKWIFLFASLMALPFAATEVATLNYASFPPHILFELAFLVLFSTFITYFLIPIGQKRIRPTLVSMYSYTQPIIAIAASIMVGMDTLSWQKVLATITVFSGVILVSYSKGKKQA